MILTNQIMNQLGLSQLKHYSQMNYFHSIRFFVNPKVHQGKALWVVQQWIYIFFMEVIIKKSLMYSNVLKLVWAIFT